MGYRLLTIQYGSVPDPELESLKYWSTSNSRDISGCTCTRDFLKPRISTARSSVGLLVAAA